MNEANEKPTDLAGSGSRDCYAAYRAIPDETWLQKHGGRIDGLCKRLRFCWLSESGTMVVYVYPRCGPLEPMLWIRDVKVCDNPTAGDVRRALAVFNMDSA